MSRNCWSKEKAEKVHVAQSEKDEPSSLHGKCMRPQFQFQIHGDGGPARRSKGGTSWGANSTGGGASVRSDRQEGRATQAPAMDPRHRGATNHMTGARSAFFELDSGIRGTVKSGDGSILFVSKGGEHRKLTYVYFIPRLKANLVSLGQLDETGCFISIERELLKIYDNQRRLLTQARRTTNRLYILELEIEQPVSLSAKTQERYLGGGTQGTGT